MRRGPVLFRQLWPKALSLIDRIGIDPDDGDELRRRKRLAVRATLGGIGVQLLIGAVFLAYNEPLPAWPVFGGAAFLFANLLVFGLTRCHFHGFVFGGTLVPLLSGPLSAALLGQNILDNSSIIWTFLAPMLIMVIYTPRHALPWLVASFGVAIGTLFVQPHIRTTNTLPPSAQVAVAAFNMVGFALFVFFSLSYFISQRAIAFRLLRAEQQKAQALLLNILPEEIAATLKDDNQAIANQFDGVSILFADVVNFTALSATMSATELVDLLNEVFSHFDTLVEKYDLEKIKTIGDCYMVAAGVPRPRSDHAHVLASLALELRDSVARREFRGKRLTFRIGIKSGPGVAGVIGRKKFIYDLWGDAVTTASRMESHGAVGAIQITQATYELIKDDFVCEPQGRIDVKGKGEMSVWHVLQKADGA